MYNVRIPYRKVTLVTKTKEFIEKIELGEGTKKELAERYKSEGSIIDFSRGFVTVQADRSELADSIFSRAHNDVEKIGE